MPAELRPVGRFVVAAGHPCLPGHFPGNPVVPGVVLLDETFAALDQLDLGALALVSAKFTAPVRADETVTVSWRAAGPTVEFACAVDGVGVMRGTAKPA